MAKRWFGVFNNFKIDAYFFSFLNSSSSVKFNEKKATSEPEIKAESIKSMVITINIPRTCKLNNCTSIPLKIDNNIETGTSSKFVII